ncbi:hypothetical protein [Colwellia hornerae]|uniref:Glycerophosphoryl diester phosphodiesterase membrane domain-containing protein n=1 Tax=Colwellia hornerae TaxID=89402 RepID=A0A5C6Q7U8_9GAMM|nr:hypothetical protein [Colwellia hornerae]TWX57754.1 hypothetical protein ESZ28_03330 [Colwellia hornerae]TWX62515.1 hypothetical protein ESZ26_01355 [Colwellia hornerae]TWX65074.1 hypothetical protein ESZ27_13220 [Colwellia hornerae]
MDEKKVVQIGGSIEKSLQGEYTIDVPSVLKEAWQLTLRSRIAINLGLLFTLILGIVVSFLISNTMGGIDQVIKDPQSTTLLNIVVTMVIYPFLVGVEMMGVFHAVGLKTNSKLIFAFLKRGSWVAVCALLTSVLITLGMSLFFFPGIYLAVALSLALPLVVEKKLSPIKAITLSLQVTRFQWFKLLSIYSLLLLTLFLSLVPLAILAKTSFSVIGVMLFLLALTFIAPLFYNVKGILYREIFGMQLQAVDVAPQQTSDTFSA